MMMVRCNFAGELFIVPKITDGSGEARSEALPQNAETSLGDNAADLAGQLASAQNALSASLIALRSSSSSDLNLIAQGDSQLGMLLALKRELSHASPAALAAIRAEIVACVANASNIAQQAEMSASGNAGPSNSLANASQAARAAVVSFEDDYYRKRKFDTYLHFASPEDEQEFRRREAERKAEIDKALSLHTPEGDLRASRLALDQMKDAGGHGADASPQYQATLTGIADREADLETAISKQQPQPPNVKHAASINYDPLDSIMPCADIPHEEIAKLKTAGVTVSTRGDGHGVTIDLSRQQANHRSPT